DASEFHTLTHSLSIENRALSCTQIFTGMERAAAPSLVTGSRLPAHDERGGAGRLAPLIAFPGAGHPAVLVERDFQTMDVHVFLRVEVGAPIEDEDQVIGPGMDPVKLHPRLVPDGAVMRHSQIFAVEMVDGDHLMTRAGELGLDQGATGTGQPIG